MRDAVTMYPNGLSVDKPSLILPTIMVFISCIGFGLVPFFAKSLSDAGVHSSLIPFYRYAISAVVFLPFILFSKVNYREVFWGLMAGTCLGFGWISYVEALKVVSVSTAGVIYMTYPMFTILIAWLWFKEKPNPRSLIATVIIIVAASLTVSDLTNDNNALPTLYFSLLAPLGFGLSINILVSKLKTLSSMARVSSVASGAVLSLSIVIAPLGIEQIIPKSTNAWILVIGIAVLTATLPQLIYSTYAPKLGASGAAIAGSIELPTMFVVGWLAFDEHITLIQYISAALVLYSIYLAGGKARRRVSKRL